MLWPPLVPATFVRRLNRFAVEVAVGGETVRAHLPNSGRLRELLVPGYRVWLAPRSGSRRTQYDLELVELPNGILASADARLPNRLFLEAWAEGRLPEFGGFSRAVPEPRLDGGRLDFRLEGPEGTAYVEVKSITLVEAGCGLFPDAPTPRGWRHLGLLTAAAQEGFGAFGVFIIQRSDARAFAPNDAVDPAFGRKLREAVRAGVRVRAYRCRVSLTEIRVEGPVPVCLGPI
ncbi:MAG: DNA/RNA nuclease SfsA [Chloroflexota bacterium]